MNTRCRRIYDDTYCYRLGDKNSGDEVFLAEIAVKVQKWKDLIDAKDKELQLKDAEISRLQSHLSSTRVEQQDIEFLLQNKVNNDYTEASLSSLRASLKERGMSTHYCAQLNNGILYRFSY